MRNVLRHAWWALCGSLALGACAPPLDWREVRPPGSHVQALFPCKPSSHARELPLAGATVELSLYACTASGATYALAFADVGDPARVTAALQALASASQTHLRASAPTQRDPANVPGMTPNPQAFRLRIDGHAPDGRVLSQTTVVFAYGTRVAQASVLGEAPSAEALQIFVESLRVRP